MNTCTKITIKHCYDESPDLSHYGEYTNTPDIGNVICKTHEIITDETDLDNIPNRSNRFRCFKPYASGEIPGSPRYNKYALNDFLRMDEIANGMISIIGIKAIAQIEIPMPGTYCRIIHPVESSGTWGIESDSDTGEITGIEKEQLAELTDILTALNVSGESITECKQRIESEPL